MGMKLYKLSELKKIHDNQPKEKHQCFYSTRTIWWASSWDHLKKGPSGLPLDLFGAPLHQSEKTDQFFDADKVKKQAAYGKYPVTTWVMAHHLNLSALTPVLANEIFPNALADVSQNYEHFAKLIAAAVDAGKIPNLEE